MHVCYCPWHFFDNLAAFKIAHIFKQFEYDVHLCVYIVKKYSPALFKYFFHILSLFLFWDFNFSSVILAVAYFSTAFQ